MRHGNTTVWIVAGEAMVSQGTILQAQGHRLFQIGVPRSRSFDVAGRGSEGCFPLSRRHRSSVTVAPNYLDQQGDGPAPSGLT